MKISLNWIGDFVDLSGVSAEKVSNLLSLHTAEVEGIEVYGEAIQDVVVGHVVACGQHPDAEKLSVTEVDFGGEENVAVVCGAPNVRVGLKIAFAPVGSSLPGDLKIKKAKLRGQESRGMICSERELEMSEEHDGIMELPEDAPIGVPLIDYLELRDHILELDNKSLTHRPDLWGHYGFARELSALLQRTLKPLPIDVAWPEAKSAWSVQRTDAEGCAVYSALEIELGGAPRNSNPFISRRLLAVGQRLVNDVVDLSNYVMLEIGQPTHAFDASTISGKAIEVRAAQEGESIVTLDGVDRALIPEDLVIADAKQAIALAGVMGGKHTEVSDTTERIVLEAAAFHATRVRRTAHRLALRSEASSRFEKTLDPAYAAEATARFCHLLLQDRPEAKILGVPSISAEPVADSIQLPLDPVKTSKLLGISLREEEMVSMLEGIGFSPVKKGEGYLVKVPSWRSTKDVTLPIDLVEEVGRMFGYDRIVPAALEAPVEVPVQQPQRLLARKLVNRLVLAHAAHETQSYSFLDCAWAERLGRKISDFERLDNPVLAEVSLIRRDPIPSLLEQAAGNLNEFGQGRLCEVAKGYEPQAGIEPLERRWLGVVEWGEKSLPKQGQESLFGRMRGLGEDLMRSVGVAKEQLSIQPQNAELTAPDWAHPVQTLHWSLGGQPLGWSTRVHPQLLRELDFGAHDCSILLFDLEALSVATQDRHPSFETPSRFPGIKVDVALALPDDKSYAEVEIALKKAGGKLLDSLELFDVYTGEGMADGQRSLAFRCLLRAADRTLSDKEEQKFLRKVDFAAIELGGNLRS
ncbi:MAG: phenylalanine--tRNA ligase subunit beta [Planctomycetota bacterium]|nr:phenylalanine--tRNA ligase subunit beta [Planctomycetota bacterium]